MTVGKGQLIGLEDIVNNRYNTISLRCISLKGVLVAIKAADVMFYIIRDQELY